MHVLFCAFGILGGLEDAGILRRVKDGRRNSYVIATGERLRHPIESHCTVGELLATILSPEDFENLCQHSVEANRCG